jgi:ankyrin repeat protein
MELLNATAAERWGEAEGILNLHKELLTSDREGAATPLAVYAAGGDVAQVRFLLKHGARVNLAADLGMTALHWAAATGEKGVADELLAAGADAAIRNWFLLTPAQLAQHNSHDALAKQLSGGKAVVRVTPMNILKLMGCS